MLIWFILFLIILLVSFVLAYKSMNDYQERPLKSSVAYSLFLIKKPENMTPELLDKLGNAIKLSRSVLSFERLFKGGKKALVIFGPVLQLKPFSDVLGLLELEDYSQKGCGEVVAWEVGTKNDKNLEINDDLFKDLPQFNENEEFWWQLALAPTGNLYKGIIRVVVWTGDKKRTQQLQENLSKTGNNAGLAKLPQSHENLQVVKLYQERSVPQFELEVGALLKISSAQIKPLLGV